MTTKAPRLRVKNFGDALKQLREANTRGNVLHNQVAAVQQENAECRERLSAEQQRRYKAEREIEETRKQFADLKTKLHNAEIEVARLNGYMQRVREDDAVADPLVEVEDGHGKRMVSKRHPGTSTRYDPNWNDGYGLAAAQQNQKHWVTY